MQGNDIFTFAINLGRVGGKRSNQFRKFMRGLCVHTGFISKGGNMLFNDMMKYLLLHGFVCHKIELQEYLEKNNGIFFVVNLSEKHLLQNYSVTEYLLKGIIDATENEGGTTEA